MAATTIVTFGHGERRRLGDGWHEREPWGVSGPDSGGRSGLVYRNTSGRAALLLEPDWAGARLRLLVSANVTLAGAPVTVTLSAGERPVAESELEDDRWRIVEARLPEEIEEGDELEIAVSPVYVPDKVSGNGDQRELGVRVAAARIKKP